jgi:hypothetical protein
VKPDTGFAQNASADVFREISANLTVALLEMMYAVATDRQSFYISNVFLSLGWRERRPFTNRTSKFFPGNAE